MKFTSLLLISAPFLSGLSSACGHSHGDGKEWTKEELDALEEKWGFEVCDHALLLGYQMADFLCCVAPDGVYRDINVCAFAACQMPYTSQ